ncbi:MAG: branched-chain amino acid ABC transporter permease [Acidobacteria bacterium]|nr:branched-chain amino acid ABC transporter permease [Acidobacteriota bacterium]
MREPIAPRRRAHRIRLLGIALLAAAGVSLAAVAPAMAATPSPTPTPTNTVVQSATITAVPQCTVDPALGCVAGTLNDGNGNGVKGVTISMSDAGSDAASTVTNAEGHFAFKVSQNGLYTLTLKTSTLPSGVKAAVTQRKVQAVVGALRAAFFELSGSFKGSKATTSTVPTTFIGTAGQLAAQGLLLGLLLALASIGLSLIYGTTGLSNFAHAEQVTLGGFMAYSFGTVLGLPFILAALAAVVVGAASGYLQDRFIWGPLRKRGLGLTQLMVVTIGLSFAAEYVFQYFYGSQVQSVSSGVQLNTGPLNITPAAYWSMLVSIVVLVLVGLALQRTRIGRAARAVSDNRALAAASGIDVDRVIRLVWTVAMGLAALSGALYALVYGGIQWSTGVQILLLLFAAVTLGGLGTAFGALVGSIVIGLVVQLSTLFLSNNVKYATALFILILVLVFRPQGILGRKERVG